MDSRVDPLMHHDGSIDPNPDVAAPVPGAEKVVKKLEKRAAK